MLKPKGERFAHQMLWDDSIDLLSIQYHVQKQHSHTGKCHHVTTFKSVILCFQLCMYLTGNTGFLVGLCGDIYEHNNILHALLNGHV